jgi:hypothetical protein
MVVHAAGNIVPTEELTHNYLDAFDGFSQRQAYLREEFGFICCCEICCMTGLEVKLGRETSCNEQMRGNGCNIDIHGTNVVFSGSLRSTNAIREEGYRWTARRQR